MQGIADVESHSRILAGILLANVTNSTRPFWLRCKRGSKVVVAQLKRLIHDIIVKSQLYTT